MTTQEAIEILTQDNYGNCDCGNWCQAYDMAIRSLEAWKKVKDKIETEIPCYSETIPFHQGVRIGLNVANQIIDKYLKEVENDTKTTDKG